LYAGTRSRSRGCSPAPVVHGNDLRGGLSAVRIAASCGGGCVSPRERESLHSGLRSRRTLTDQAVTTPARCPGSSPLAAGPRRSRRRTRLGSMDLLPLRMVSLSRGDPRRIPPVWRHGGDAGFHQCGAAPQRAFAAVAMEWANESLVRSGLPVGVNRKLMRVRGCFQQTATRSAGREALTIRCCASTAGHRGHPSMRRPVTRGASYQPEQNVLGCYLRLRP
jgi:hypothetical protein